MSFRLAMAFLCVFLLFFTSTSGKVYGSDNSQSEASGKTKKEPAPVKESIPFKSMFNQGVIQAGFSFNYFFRNFDFEVESEGYDFERKITTMGFSANLGYFIVEALSLFTDFSYSSYDQQQESFGYRIVEAAISGGLHYYHFLNPNLFLVSGVGFFYHHRNSQDLSFADYFGGLVDLSVGIPLNSYVAVEAGCRVRYLFSGEAEEDSFNSANLSGYGFEGRLALQIFF
ncbi:MAG: hypothetical protein ACQES9_07860 [Myxococcota bacterium]